MLNKHASISTATATNAIEAGSYALLNTHTHTFHTSCYHTK